MTRVKNINTWLTHLTQESKTSLSVDCVIFGYDEEGLKVLLIDCNMPPYEGKKSLLGDLVQMNETLEDAVIRVLQRRTTLTDLYFEEVKAYSDPNRHPLGRVVTIAYYSFIKISDYKIHDSEDKHLEWIPINDIDELAFDHRLILDESYKSLKKKIRNHPIGFTLLPEKFTLMQLQNFYETVLQIKMDRRNFRRKLNSLDLLIDLNEIQNNVSHRPAKLYSFDFKKYDKLMEKGLLNFTI
jgi:8-oxo-dGTP diphosphatase